MQAKQFEHEKMGVPITEEMLQCIQKRNSTESYPFLYPGTTDLDYGEAKFVLSRKRTIGVTLDDLDAFRENRDAQSSDESRFSAGFEDDHDVDFNTDGYVPPASEVTVAVSDATRQLQDTIANSVCRYKITSTQRTDYRKSMMNVIDGVLDDPDNSKNDIDFFKSGLLELKNQLREKKERENAKRKGDIETEDEQSSKRARLTDEKNGSEEVPGEEEPTIVWSAKTSRRGPKDVRHRNSLG